MKWSLNVDKINIYPPPTSGQIISNWINIQNGCVQWSDEKNACSSGLNTWCMGMRQVNRIWPVCVPWNIQQIGIVYILIFEMVVSIVVLNIQRHHSSIHTFMRTNKPSAHLFHIDDYRKCRNRDEAETKQQKKINKTKRNIHKNWHLQSHRNKLWDRVIPPSPTHINPIEW